MLIFGVILSLEHFRFWNIASIGIPERGLLEGNLTSIWSFKPTNWDNRSMVSIQIKEL